MEMGLPAGKLPYEELVKLVISGFVCHDPDVIVGPGIGQDAALIRIGRKVIAMHTDPVTGSVQDIGWVAVNVAANDISSRGVEPRWISVVVLLPEGVSKKMLKSIMRQVKHASEEIGACVVGGHTEVTVGIKRPILVVTAVGESIPSKFVTTSGANPGDVLILTKGVAIEGTAILAAEIPDTLIKLGISRRVIARAREFRRMLSIVKDARTAMRCGGVTAMHDVTEGGVAAAMQELAVASHLGLEAYESEMNIFPETARICSSLKADPLKMIGSGALLIAANKSASQRIVKALAREGICASQVGELTSREGFLRLYRSGGKVEDLSRPVHEELWRILRRKLL
jgi:hydrogenase maturation factor